MKKMFFSGIAIVTLSTAAFFATNLRQTSELTPLQLANIEALANDGEGEPEVPVKKPQVCYDMIKNAIGAKVRYCGNCEFIQGTPADLNDISSCMGYDE